MNTDLSKTKENSVENSVQRPQNKHLKPFKKGENGGSKGRPLGKKNYDTLMREAIIRHAKKRKMTPEEIELLLYEKGLVLAIKGDYSFFKDYLDRTHGKPIQPIGGKNGEPIVLNIAFDEAFKKRNED